MKLSEKILELRKSKGMSQEELADKLYISRQAVSRWESGTALPDANNILRISKLFGVTTDYLLNDDYHSDDDLPKIKAARNNNLEQIIIYLLTIEVISVFLQFICAVILQNVFVAFLSFIPFIAAISGFEYSCQRNINRSTDSVKSLRQTFYKKSAWLGLYFPSRFAINIIARFYPRPYNTIIFEIIVVILYIMSATLVNVAIDKSYIVKK